jgi:hypothetical protein
MRAHVVVKALVVLSALAILLSLPCLAGGPDPRVIMPAASLDRNHNRIADRLEDPTRLPSTSGGLLVSLDHPPAAADFQRVRGLGCTVVKNWDRLVYLMHVQIPANANVPALAGRLARLPGVTFVNVNARGKAALYYSTRQVGARAAWELTPPIEGSPSQAIAILDTGIDDSHSDFTDRVSGWKDFAGATAQTGPDDTYATPTDRNGHGTCVAGIAAGSGTAGGISTALGQLPITLSELFDSTAYYD